MAVPVITGLTALGVEAGTAATAAVAGEVAATGAMLYAGIKGTNKRVPLAEASEVHTTSGTHKKLRVHSAKDNSVVKTEQYENPPLNKPAIEGRNIVDNKIAEQRGRGGGGEEPNDPIVHAQEVGSGMNTCLNEMGMSENYATIPFEGVVESFKRDGNGIPLTLLGTDKVNKGFFHFPVSMSMLRYNSPFKEFISLYEMYRVRGFQLEFHPIKLSTEYIVGQQQTTVQEVVGEGEAAVNDVLHKMEVNTSDLNNRAGSGMVPRVGPVTTAFVPRGVDDPYDMAVTWDSDFSEVNALSGAIVHTTTNDTLPSVMVEYLPDLGSNTCGFRSPHPASRYSDTDWLVADACWPSLGSFYLMTSETMTSIPLYMVTGKLLVEFAAICSVPRLIPNDPSLHPDFVGPAIAVPEDENDRRRLVSLDTVDNRHKTARASWGSKTKFAVVNNFEASGNGSGNAVMNAQINTNAASILSNTSRLATVESLASNLKSHQGEAAYNVHIAGSGTDTSLAHRITSNDTDLGALDGRVSANEAAITGFQNMEMPALVDGNLELAGTGLVIVNQELAGGGINPVEYTTAKGCVKLNQMTNILQPTNAAVGLLATRVTANETALALHTSVYTYNKTINMRSAGELIFSDNDAIWTNGSYTGVTLPPGFYTCTMVQTAASSGGNVWGMQAMFDHIAMAAAVHDADGPDISFEPRQVYQHIAHNDFNNNGRLYIDTKMGSPWQWMKHYARWENTLNNESMPVTFTMKRVM